MASLQVSIQQASVEQSSLTPMNPKLDARFHGSRPPSAHHTLASRLTIHVSQAHPSTTSGVLAVSTSTALSDHISSTAQKTSAVGPSSHQQTYTRRDPDDERVAKVNICCLRRCWNRKPKLAILQALRQGPAGRFIDLLIDHPTATTLAESELHGEELEKFRVLRDPLVIQSLHTIIQNVFGGVKIMTPNMRGNSFMQRAYSYHDLDGIHSEHKPIVTKAIIYGYELLQASLRDQAMQEGLRDEMFYRICLTLDQPNIKQVVFENKNEDYIFDLLMSRCQSAGLSVAKLSNFIQTDSRMSDLTDAKSNILVKLRQLQGQQIVQVYDM